jgi:serine/threonine-protein kinase
MATVYLAHDLKHDRKVAIKVMRPELSAILGGERFLREVSIAAKLNHPHILALYDSGEAEEFLYYVMPYVEGESLREKLNREKQLSVDEAISITTQVGAALDYAHEQGVIHRDIKPENILMYQGEALVADFGIALAVRSAGGTRLTDTGLSLGTPEYMSPEQATGERELDARSDVYSLAAVMYEMLVGEPPHTGPTVQAIMAKLLNERPISPRTLRDTVTEELEDVLMKGLAKLPADRFSGAMQFAQALVPQTLTPREATHGLTRDKRLLITASLIILVVAVLATRELWMGPSADRSLETQDASYTLTPDTPPPQSLAVLYFADMSGSQELAFLADGLTEALIDTLRRLAHLDVRSRNAMAPYRTLSVSPDSIARVLEVDALINGTVDSADGEVFARVWLVDGATGYESEPREVHGYFQEILILNDELVTEVLGLWDEWPTLSWRRSSWRPPRREVDLARSSAWILVRQAERMRHDAEVLVEGDDVNGATQAFLQADSVLAAAELADPHWTEPIVLRGSVANRLSRMAENQLLALSWIDSAIAHADRALATDSNDARALEVRGTARYFRWTRYRPNSRDEADQLFQLARQDLESALEADQTLASAHNVLSVLYVQEGDFTSAMLQARRAYEADAYVALADEVLNRLFWSAYNLEQHTEALDWCDEGRRRFPADVRFAECQIWLLTTDAKDPNVDAAWELASEIVERTPEPNRDLMRHVTTTVASGVLALAGLEDSARSVLLRNRASRDVDPTLQLRYYEAYMRVLLGDHDEAIDLLREFFAANPEQDHGQEESGEVYWWWRDLQSHPRFGEVMRGG